MLVGGVTVQRHACDSFVVLRISDAQWYLVRHVLAPVVTVLWVGCVVMMCVGGGGPGAVSLCFCLCVVALHVLRCKVGVDVSNNSSCKQPVRRLG
jgi:hypothetical protein